MTMTIAGAVAEAQRLMDAQERTREFSDRDVKKIVEWSAEHDAASWVAEEYAIPRMSRRRERELSRWRIRRAKGRHAARHGRKPRPVGLKSEWHLDERGLGWSIGPALYMRKLARRTLGFRKTKRRRFQ